MRCDHCGRDEHADDEGDLQSYDGGFECRDGDRCADRMDAFDRRLAVARESALEEAARVADRAVEFITEALTVMPESEKLGRMCANEEMRRAAGIAARIRALKASP